MNRAVIITGPGFEDTEFFYPYYRLQEAGFSVDVCTSTDGVVSGKHGISAKPTINFSALDAKQFDLLVIPGGHEAPDRVRQVPEILKFTKAMHDLKKPIASICHGPWVLVSAGIMKGKKATCYKGCKDDLINAGASYIDEPVVVDGTLVTAQHFRDNAIWMKETLKLFRL
ncbi:MAG TPA: type 1 glutamine amidotransferase domain-containing protein [Candidatus Omnitrophota bacterium]|nr:type 1 glutamine amidotransferase domain-containing protein [Candidatus Omnitrophota bacterium]HPD85578.1 type 1 glutamine amidotransferase domain-containing protein [Candidatus Omnitrophota bacterium]HRZ04382.1 type 1 glutamine amidotransferase domain-containing protein [Candidatus Omnitrophota bacterium]